MAVSAGISAVLAWSPPQSAIPAAIQSSAERGLVPDLVDRWNAAVAADLSEDPFTEAEHAIYANVPLSDETAYGSTLLVAAFTTEYVVFAQIGDGNFVAVLPDGGFLSPVPDDSNMDGWRTSSLCQPNASTAFRVGVIQFATRPLFAVLAATDGYGNAQADDPWQPGVAADLVGLALEHDLDWFAGQVPNWAARCASSEGSGDDSTIALVINSAAMLKPPRRGTDHLARTATVTIPARTLELFPPGADQAAAGDVAGEDLSRDWAYGGVEPDQQTGRRRRLIPVWALVLAVALVAAGLALALLLRGPGAHRPGPSPRSTHHTSNRPSQSHPPRPESSPPVHHGRPVHHGPSAGRRGVRALQPIAAPPRRWDPPAFEIHG